VWTRGLLSLDYCYDYWYVEYRVDDLDLLDERLRKRVPLKSQRTGVDHPSLDASGVCHSIYQDMHGGFILESST